VVDELAVAMREEQHGGGAARGAAGREEPGFGAAGREVEVDDLGVGGTGWGEGGVGARIEEAALDGEEERPVGDEEEQCEREEAEQGAKLLGKGWRMDAVNLPAHCEERSDEAIP
jgi:hypothetical protein